MYPVCPLDTGFFMLLRVRWLTTITCLLFLAIGPGPDQILSWMATILLLSQTTVSLFLYYLLAWKNRPPVLMRVSVTVELNPFFWRGLWWKKRDPWTTFCFGPFKVGYREPPPKMRKTSYVETRRRLTVVRGHKR